MSREERRRAERQLRRNGPGSDRPGVRGSASRPSDAERVQAILAKNLPGRAATVKPAVESPHVDGPIAAPATTTTVAVATATTPASLRTISVGCQTLTEADPQALGMTYEFEAAASGPPYPISIRFDGQRQGLTGETQPQDRFSVVETIARVVPGSGRVTLSRRVSGIAAGRWSVSAAPVAEPGTPQPLPARESAAGSTGFAPVVRVRAPGVRLAAWPGLVGLGAVVALLAMSLLASRLGLPVTHVLVLALVASLVGLVGAKLYYLAEHPTYARSLASMTGGMCIQGFVLAAIGTIVLGALLLDLSVGSVLDATAPGLLFGMAIGRVGCFLGGCCAGRPTASRWGLWSSDRRLGVRRIPTQLLESTMALVLGLVSLLVVVIAAPQPAGMVFVAGISAYTGGRQLLFPLRDLPRRTARGRIATLAVCTVLLVAAVLAAVLG